MDPRRRTEIGKLAQRVREAAELGVPTDVEHLAKLAGGSVEDVDDLELDMEAEVRKVSSDSFVIRLRSSVPQTRRRFSIGHELGHLFLHMGFLIDEAKWQATGTYFDSVRYRFGFSEEEYEANEFAAALLMPAAEFRDEAMKNLSSSGYHIEAIAAHFGVSPIAAKVRGQWLGLFPWMTDTGREEHTRP